MMFTSQPDESDFEVTPLDTRPRRRRAGRRPRLSRAWRVALTVCALALAIVAPLASLPSTRAALGRLFAAPTATTAAQVSAQQVVVSVATTTTDIAPAVWDKLRARPLSLPTLPAGAPCPAAQGRTVYPAYGPAIGAGPVYVVGMGTTGVLNAVGPAPISQDGGGAWGFENGMFIIAPSYTGPALIRGGQIDSSQPLLFNGGVDQLDGFSPASPTLLRQLRIEGGQAFGSPWATWPTYLRMRTTGCYAIQIDGTTFSKIRAKAPCLEVWG